jgi:hypothetical protein
MKGILPPLAAALALLLSAPVPARAVLERFEAEARGTLTIEPDGRVSEVSLSEALKPPLRALYEDAIRAWTFQPVEVDGQVVRALGHMRLDLYMEIRGSALVSAGITKVDFVDPPSGATGPRPGERRLTPPRYPPSLAARGMGGRVELLVETDAAGRVTRVATRGGVLHARAEGAEPGAVRRAFAELAEASERAAKRWTVTGCEGRCTLPIHYQVLAEGAGERFSTRFRLNGPAEGIELFREEG